MAHDEHGFNVMKMTIPPKTVYRLNAFLTKTPTTFFRDRRKNSKVLMEAERVQYHQSNLQQIKNNAGGIAFPEFKNYQRTLVIRSIWYQSKERHIGQWKTTEHPNESTRHYGRLILDKGDNAEGNTGQSANSQGN